MVILPQQYIYNNMCNNKTHPHSKVVFIIIMEKEEEDLLFLPTTGPCIQKCITLENFLEALIEYICPVKERRAANEIY